jgi:hypothetical protein
MSMLFILLLITGVARVALRRTRASIGGLRPRERVQECGRREDMQLPRRTTLNRPAGAWRGAQAFLARIQPGMRLNDGCEPCVR